jgi:AraC family transcriptional regulator
MRAAPREIVCDLAASRSTLIDVVYPPDTEFPTHVHTAAYLALVVRGEYDEWSPRRRRAGTGDVVEYAAGSRHAVRTAGNPVRVFHVAMEDGAFPDHPMRAGMLWQLARETTGAADDASRLVRESIALELIDWPDSGTHESAGRPVWLAATKRRLRDGYGARVTLRSLADGAGLHPSHFAREFRRWTGMTAGTFLRRMRLAAAVHRLTTTARPAARIAIETGFSDQSHMGRVFRRFLGATPAAFRASLACGGSPDSIDP